MCYNIIILRNTIISAYRKSLKEHFYSDKDTSLYNQGSIVACTITLKEKTIKFLNIMAKRSTARQPNMVLLHCLQYQAWELQW